MSREAHIWRDDGGVPHVEARREVDVYWGQGVVHATDRGLQMLLTRITAQGRTSELLKATDEALAVDTFFRRMNWCGEAQPPPNVLGESARARLEAYCDGVNSVLSRKTPWELKLFGYRAEPWRIEDAVTLSRLIGYVSLAQSQGEMERLLVEMVQSGVELRKLEELFPGSLDDLDVSLLEKVAVEHRIVPPEVAWGTALPRMTASNAWVVSGERTASGSPIVANDPHLEGNRLPAVWCEIALHADGRYLVGGSMPGAPGILLGRTPDIAWGVTYAFADTIDSWIERCRDGKCYRQPDRWIPFRRRREVIRRKGKEPVEITVYENEHGILDGDPHRDGYCLATRWAAA
ncbi:MAG: penicillin acylase family protein, partial [Planctomycetota bacterium]